MLENKLAQMNTRLNEFGTTIGKSAPCNPNPKNLTDEQKKQIVKETIEQMEKDGIKLSQERVICQSGISWRISRGVLSEYKKGLIV